MAALTDQRLLWDLKAIMYVAGVSRAGAYRLVSRADFPKPIRVPGMNPKWFAEDVKEYFREKRPESPDSIAKEMPQTYELPTCAGRGVYVLLYRGGAVYVGKSESNLFQRLGVHARTKRFDGIRWHPLGDGDDIDAVERRLIRELQPAYNEVHK